MGSNLETPLAQLRTAKRALESLGSVTACSSLYETAPVGGPAGQPNFLNAVVLLEPSAHYAEPVRLLKALHAIEQKQGRTRRIRWDARTLDLDLLAYGQYVLNNGLSLPHPRMMTRSFVLMPLCELVPEWQHPVTGERACEVLLELGTEGIRKTELSWEAAST